LLSGPTKTLKSKQKPIQLPAELLPALVLVKRLLLCLDYDGTISEIVPDPALARPVPGVLEALTELAARRDQIALAIVSGREVTKLRELLNPPPGIALSGIHGLELVDFDGSEEIMRGARDCTEDLEKDSRSRTSASQSRSTTVTHRPRRLAKYETRSPDSYMIARRGLR
jgi:alpha,alpha-trehalase